jgi:hypothetical protein
MEAIEDDEPNFMWPMDANNFTLEDWMMLDPFKTVDHHPVLEYPPAALYMAVFKSRHRHWKFDEEIKYFNHGWSEDTWKKHCITKLEELASEGDADAKHFLRARRNASHRR